MKKNIIKSIALLLVVVMFCFVNLPVSSVNSAPQSDIISQKTNVINVSSVVKKSLDINEVYAARFLNMLNHNFVYDDSFKSVEDIVNDSMPALLNLRESEEDAIISETIVSDYIYNMYGIEDIDYSSINTEFERIEGYVYIIPRGFSVYKHEIAAITENEDGSFTVLTEVTISSHDSSAYTDVCETLFVRNEKSSFGFSIIRSNIGANTIAM